MKDPCNVGIAMRGKRVRSPTHYKIKLFSFLKTKTNVIQEKRSFHVVFSTMSFLVVSIIIKLAKLAAPLYK